MIGPHAGLGRRRPPIPGVLTHPAITGVRSDGWSLDYASPPTFDPVNNPKYLALSRQGFTTAGGATTYSEALLITQRVRQPYPSQASLDATRAALQDYVYSTDAIVGGSSPTNNSAETSPKPIARWARPDRTTVGNTLRLEVVAAHRNARNREEIACVIFSATDGTTTVTATVSTSTILGHANDLSPIIGYAVDLDISTLSDNAAITANAEVCPWIGGAASVLKSADSSAGSRNFAPQTFYKSMSKAANPPIVYISTTGADKTVNSSGNATSGGETKVSTIAATAAANPFLTWNSALLALLAATNVTGGRADGCEVRYAAGTNTVGAGTANTYTVVSEVIVRADPAASPGTVILSLGANWATRAAYLRFKDLAFTRATTAQITVGAANGTATFENCAYANGGANAALLSGGSAGNPVILRALGLAISGSSTLLLSPVAAYECRLLRGVSTDAASALDPFCALGSNVTNSSFVSGSAVTEPGFIGYNSFFAQASQGIGVGLSADVAGFALLQNLIEYTSASTTNPAFRPSGDGNVGNVTHLVAHHNTFVGALNAGRGNILYDEGTTGRAHKLQSFVGNIHVQINTKSDIFKTDGTRTGNWAYMYGVGCRGEFTMFVDANSGGGGGGASHGSFMQAYPGLNASIGASATVRNDPLLTSYQGTTVAAGPTYTAGAGGGAYTLQSGSPCIGSVKAPVLRFDLAGSTRSASATATGAYKGASE